MSEHGHGCVVNGVMKYGLLNQEDVAPRAFDLLQHTEDVLTDLLVDAIHLEVV